MKVEIINQGKPRINFGGIEQKGYKATAAFFLIYTANAVILVELFIMKMVAQESL